VPRPARTNAAIDAVETPPLPQSSQVTASALAARSARHHESATTATASGIRTTPRTPAISAIEFASTDFSLPPNTGQCRIAA
jgi:hypothetical protein